ncbi:MAG: acyltransferase family protein, partial [Planctomycetota bacterium]
MNERRHDLDALRAGAMLLGIVLHAALSYTGIPIWPTVDDAWPPFMEIHNIIHGFRMPLFFLLSGFFTAMLWKRRGLGGLLIHRVKRILLPLVVGMFTIIPLTWVAIVISEGGGKEDGPKPSDSLWAAAAFGDLGELDRFLAEKPDVNAQDPFTRQTALGWACNTGQPQAVAKLLEAGADPNQRYGNEGKDTALHSAVFFGRGECTALLIEAGADQTARNQSGERPVDLLEHNFDFVQYIAGFLKIPVEPRAWEKGRERAKQLLDIPEQSTPQSTPAAVSEAAPAQAELNLEPL